MEPGHETEGKCPTEAALAVIGGRWKVPILWNLIQGTLRFGELSRALSSATQKMLTQQLRELERDGLVHRKVYAEIPPKVEYSLTPLGRSLEPVLASLTQWGAAYLARGHGSKPAQKPGPKTQVQ